MPKTPDPERVEQRAAELLPEEEAASVDDAAALARAVLADSDARTDQRDDERAAPQVGVEHRRSEDTVDPEPGSSRST
jgi:hypothetical protein